MHKSLFAAAMLSALCLGACSGHPSQPPDAATGELKSPGQILFEKHCSSCHGAGIGNPGFSQKTGTAALEAKYQGELPALLEERTDLTPDLVEFVVRNGVTVMAPYRKTEISDAELEAIAAYLSRNNPDLQASSKP